MGCEVPQIFSDRMSIRTGDWFRGITFKPLDSKDLSEKIVYLLKNVNLRKKIGRESRGIALKIGDWEKNMEEWKKIYNSIVH